MNLRDIYAKNKTLEDHNATLKLLAHIATMTQMNEAPDSSRGGAEALARLQEQEARSSRRFGLCFQFCPTSFSGDPSKPRLKQHRAVASSLVLAQGLRRRQLISDCPARTSPV